MIPIIIRRKRTGFGRSQHNPIPFEGQVSVTEEKNDQAKLVQEDPKLGRLVNAMAEVQKEAVEKKQATRKQRTRKRGISPIFPVILLILLPAAYFVARPPTENLAPVPAETALRETVYVTSLALESEFEETGEFPADLETIGMDEEGLTYSRDGAGYTLIAEWEGARVQFRSGEDLEPFRRAFETLLPPFGEGQ